jgi:hypothetical protein
MQNLPRNELDALANLKDAGQLMGWNESKELIADLRDHSLFQRLRTAMLCSDFSVQADGELRDTPK